nr:SLBB domain-containing protein [Mesotoga sp.]
EKLTLSTLIARAGGTTPEALVSKVQITDQFGRTTTMDLEMILQGKALDVKLEDRAFVYVPVYEPVTVSVLGEVRSPGQVTFSKTEIPGLLLAISKAGGLTDEASSEIKIVGLENQSYWHQLMEGQDITLKNGQTVFVPGGERYVYITGEVASTGRYDFTAEERMTVMRTITKAGGARETASDELRVVTPSGQVIPVKLSELLSGKSDATLETASTIVVPKKVTRITILGAVRNPGMYTFNRDESSSLVDVVAKAGGLTDQKNVNRILVQNANEIREFAVAALEKRGDNLPDNAFVYVSSLEAAYVTVLGDVPKPGRYSLEGTQPVSVAEIIAMAGGLGNTVNTLSVISADGKIKLLNALKTEELTRSFLQNRDTIIALKNYDSYVSIIGDVKFPGVFSIGDYGELTLAELITMAGGFNSLEFSRRVQIQSTGKTEELTVGPDNFLLLSTRELEPGSVIFVPYIQAQRVYVFGEVLRPGVVKYLEGMTAIEAVIEAGGPTSYAVLGNVLLFQDPQKEPMVLNLDQQKGSPVKGNVKLVPGNIIYVPQSSIVNIKDIMSIVASSLSIVNSAVGIFK